jgi:hypothetical protein
MRIHVTPVRAFSLVEVIIVSAVLFIFFSGLVTMVMYVVELVTNARVRLSALSAATERIEFIRSLPYDSVGTVAGIPSGAIPQTRTVTLNNYTFRERVLIQFVDDPADGFGAADGNGIVADYKQVKVEYSWNVTGATSSIFLLSTIVPRSVETTAGGGTIRVNVVDATAQPLSGASVRVLNTTGTTSIDVTRLTDASGTVLIAGAPAQSGYQLFVTRPGYSTDKTYLATTSNPNPLTQPISVLLADVSTMDFQIDRLSTLTLRAFSSVTEDVFRETFSSAGGIVASSAVAVTGGELTLQSVAGAYATSGSAYLSALAPTTLDRWEAVSWAVDAPPLTTAVVRFYTGTSGSYTLIPDSDLPGNGAGFSSRFISLRNLPVATYPVITPAIELYSSSTSVSPEVDDFSLWYRQSATPIAGQPFSLRGAKVIGTDLLGDPVYKTSRSGTLSGAGEQTLTDIEWDTYFVNFSGQFMQRACAAHPVVVIPNTNAMAEFVLGGTTQNSLRLKVVDTAGVVVPGASVTLSRPGFSQSVAADSCGSRFFNALANESDYVVTVSAPGFQNSTLNNFSISGPATLTVTLTEV